MYSLHRNAHARGQQGEADIASKSTPVTLTNKFPGANERTFVSNNVSLLVRQQHVKSNQTVQYIPKVGTVH